MSLFAVRRSEASQLDTRHMFSVTYSEDELCLTLPCVCILEECSAHTCIVGLADLATPSLHTEDADSA